MGSVSARTRLTSLIWVSRRSSSSSTSSFCDNKAISCSSRPLSSSMSSSRLRSRWRSLSAAMISGTFARISMTCCRARSQRSSIIRPVFCPSRRRFSTMSCSALSSRMSRHAPVCSRSGVFFSITPGQRRISTGLSGAGLSTGRLRDAWMIFSLSLALTAILSRVESAS